MHTYAKAQPSFSCTSSNTVSVTNRIKTLNRAPVVIAFKGSCTYVFFASLNNCVAATQMLHHFAVGFLLFCFSICAPSLPSIKSPTHTLVVFIAIRMHWQMFRQTDIMTHRSNENTASERKKEGLKTKRKRNTIFRLCDMSRFCQCQDYRRPLGFGNGSIFRQRWIIGYFE